MKFRGDDRGQSVQVGAILLFAILIIAMATYQAQVVPSSNAAVEFEHAQQVESEFIDLRSSVLTAARTGNPQSTALTLGTRYPQRPFFVNPPPATGTVSTSSDRTLRIENANVSASGNVEAFWNARNLSFTTQSIRYVPRYNEYDNPPELVYEHSLVVAEFDRSVLARTGQTAVENDELSLTLVDGDLSETGIGSRGIDTEVLSQNARSVSIESTGDPIVLILPTTVDGADKRERLADEWASEIETDATVTALNNESAIRIELNATNVSLRLAQIGVGTSTTPTDESNGYVTAVGDTTVAPGEEFTVEVRDRFNNPVGDATVTTNRGKRQSTDEDGRATFSFADTGTVELSINDGNETWETLNVTVSESAGAGGGDTPGEEGGGVGSSGESDHFYTQKKTVSASGGLWKNITAVDSINLENPRFTPIAPDDGQHDRRDRYFRLALVLNNSTTQYTFIVGDDKEGLNFRQEPNNRDWNRKGVTLYKYEEGSEPVRLFEGEDLTDAALDNWLDGDKLELLNELLYENPNDVDGDLQEIERFLNDSDDSDPVQAFITSMEGRTDLELIDGSDDNEANLLDIGNEDDNDVDPTAVNVEGSDTDDYAGLKFDLVNVMPNNQIDSIETINVTVDATNGPVTRIETDLNQGSNYDYEFYFDGNDREGRITGGFDTATTTELDQTGDIGSDSAVTVYMNEFRDGSDPVDLREGDTVSITVTYVVDGEEYYEELTFTIDNRVNNK
jgi:hypothetical protein